MTSIAVLGPGGVGGFLAGALARAGVADVTVVAREETAAVISADGLRVSSARLGDFDVAVRAVAQLEDDVDMLVIATKATTLEAALERIAGTPGLVVPLLNGLDHLTLLRARWGPRAVAATIRVGSDRPSPGVIAQTSPFLRVDLASDHPAPRPRMAAFADLLRVAEVPARLGDGEAPVLWGKLARLNALACTTSAYDLPIGPLRDHPHRRLELQDAVDETVAVGNAEGGGLDADVTMREIHELPPNASSSMARDLAAGREPELDAIPGAVQRRGLEHGIPTPGIDRLVERIRARMGVAK